MKSPPFTPSSTKGLTLIELLVALAISSIVIALVLPLLLSNQRLVKVDQSRTAVFQNLRSAMELVGTDVRIAGERLEQRGGPNIMPIEIVKGENGEPDEIILRRNLLDSVLPVCDSINANSSQNSVKVARKNHPHWEQFCDPEDSRLAEWQEYRLKNGVEDENDKKSITAFIYNPISRQGEFFGYNHDDMSKHQIHRASGSWKYDYDQEENENDGSPMLPTLYILEERRYRLNTENNILELVINGNDEEVKNIAGEIFDFRVQAVMIDGSTVDEISTTSHWRNLKAIKVTLESQSSVQDETVQRTISSRFFPRNVMSEM